MSSVTIKVLGRKRVHDALNADCRNQYVPDTNLEPAPPSPTTRTSFRSRAFIFHGLKVILKFE